MGKDRKVWSGQVSQPFKVALLFQSKDIKLYLYSVLTEYINVLTEHINYNIKCYFCDTKEQGHSNLSLSKPNVLPPLFLPGQAFSP